MDTQEEGIINYLLTGATLTALQALHKFDCMRLASRVHDLRKKGYNVQCRLSTVNKFTSSGRQKQVGVYYLTAEDIKFLKGKRKGKHDAKKRQS